MNAALSCLDLRISKRCLSFLRGELVLYDPPCPRINIPIIRTAAKPLDLLKVYLNMFRFERTDMTLQTNLCHEAFRI